MCSPSSDNVPDMLCVGSVCAFTFSMDGRSCWQPSDWMGSTNCEDLIGFYPQESTFHDPKR